MRAPAPRNQRVVKSKGVTNDEALCRVASPVEWSCVRCAFSSEKYIWIFAAQRLGANKEAVFEQRGQSASLEAHSGGPKCQKTSRIFELKTRTDEHEQSSRVSPRAGALAIGRRQRWKTRRSTDEQRQRSRIKARAQTFYLASAM